MSEEATLTHLIAGFVILLGAIVVGFNYIPEKKELPQNYRLQVPQVERTPIQSQLELTE